MAVRFSWSCWRVTEQQVLSALWPLVWFPHAAAAVDKAGALTLLHAVTSYQVPAVKECVAATVQPNLCQPRVSDICNQTPCPG